MRGIDVSHYQGNVSWSRVKNAGMEFAVIKATQGVNLTDSCLATNRAGARATGLLCGFYHFANGGDPAAEADYFLSKVGDLKQGEFLVLDFEINHANPVNWCRVFLDRVKTKTGIKPMLYTNEARVKQYNWMPLVSGDYGLWVAKYGKNDGSLGEQPETGAWAAYALWQFTSRGKVDGIVGNVDVNTSKMTVETLKKYGKAIVCTHCCPLHCQ